MLWLPIIIKNHDYEYAIIARTSVIRYVLAPYTFKYIPVLALLEHKKLFQFTCHM